MRASVYSVAGEPPRCGFGVNAHGSFNPRVLSGLQFWADHVPIPYELPSIGAMGVGAKTLGFAFTMGAPPAVGGFYTLGLIVVPGPLVSEVLLSNIGAPYLEYSFVGDHLGGLGVGTAVALDGLKHSVVMTYNGGLSTNPASYTFTLDGAAQVLAASGNFGYVGNEVSSIGARIDVFHVALHTFSGFETQGVGYNRVLTPAEIALLSTWLLTH